MCSCVASKSSFEGVLCTLHDLCQACEMLECTLLMHAGQTTPGLLVLPRDARTRCAVDTRLQH